MKWMKEEEGAIPICSWCEEVDEGALLQAKSIARHPAVAQHVALMPDCHVGYGMPIGGVIAVKNAVIPSAVGVDIGCGMVAVETDVPIEMLTEMRFRRKIQNAVKERIPVGEAVCHKIQQKWDGFEEYLDKQGERAFVSPLDRRNLGTLGGGNHFIEIQASDAGKVWLMIHSGSRNLGKRVEEHYHEKAAKFNTTFHSGVPDPDLAFLPMTTEDGRKYWRDMNFSLRYAKENRHRLMTALKETFAEFVPETHFLREVNVHHNYAVMEEHFGKTYCIHRKGATSAKLHEIGIIPGSMGTASYIVRGLGNPLSFMSCSHGAGRKMSRIAACTNLTVAECDEAMKGIVFERWHPFRKYGRTRNLPDLSEAPQAYKAIDEVIAAENDLAEPLVRLAPLSVLKG